MSMKSSQRSTRIFECVCLLYVCAVEYCHLYVGGSRKSAKQGVRVSYLFSGRYLQVRLYLLSQINNHTSILKLLPVSFLTTAITLLEKHILLTRQPRNLKIQFVVPWAYADSLFPLQHFLICKWKY